MHFCSYPENCCHRAARSQDRPELSCQKQGDACLVLCPANHLRRDEPAEMACSQESAPGAWDVSQRLLHLRHSERIVGESWRKSCLPPRNLSTTPRNSEGFSSLG